MARPPSRPGSRGGRARSGLEPTLAGDATPGGVDGGKALGRDPDRFRRQPAGDLAVRMDILDEPQIMLPQRYIREAPVGAEHEVGVVRTLDVPGGDAVELAVLKPEDRGDAAHIGELGLVHEAVRDRDV